MKYPTLSSVAFEKVTTSAVTHRPFSYCHHPLVLYHFFLPQRTLRAVMSEVITAGIQPRFKVHRNLDRRRVNVSRFESHDGVRARGGRRVSIVWTWIQPFLPCGWSVRGHRGVTILPFSLSLFLTGCMINAPALSEDHSLEKARRSRPLRFS